VATHIFIFQISQKYTVNHLADEFFGNFNASKLQFERVVSELLNSKVCSIDKNQLKKELYLFKNVRYKVMVGSQLNNLSLYHHHGTILMNKYLIL